MNGQTRVTLVFAVALSVARTGMTAAEVEPEVVESTSARQLDTVIVESTGLRNVPAFETPASLDTVHFGDSNRTQAIVSEALAGIAGLVARDRQNHAQDTQLSIRGFGARATFGVRGIRLYADGIPASMPDGQGQLSHFALAGAERIEVMRGPFSALYGNSSGGVVQLFSAEGQAGDPWRFRTALGADNSRTVSANLLGGDARGGYNIALARFDTHGYRDHSAARRDAFNMRLHRLFEHGRRLDVILNHLDLPEAQDPLGLTAQQVRDDPRQATAVATTFNTRKSVRQSQGGVSYVHPVSAAGTVHVRVHAGDRSVIQYLSVPAAAQMNPLSAGGVIDLDNRYGGADLRWSWLGELAGRRAEFTVGASVERQDQHRRGFENFVGETLGVRGALRRDERNRAGNSDQFAQLWWQAGERWSVLVGARRSTVRFRSDDRYVENGNPDDSGSIHYTRNTPVAGLVFAPVDALRVYASAGSGFETPTFNELSYRADGGAGLAFDLRPAVSRNLEAGLKWRAPQGGMLEAALFRADTDDELAVARNVGGRSSFSNVGRARREGAEATWTQTLGPDWDLRVAATWIDATFRDDFLACTGAGCTQPATAVAAGTRIPGIARQQAYARLAWQGGPWQLAAEGVAMGDVPVGDTTRESAPGYGLVNLEVARSWEQQRGSLRAFLRLDNAFDRAYVGSVIVNEGNGRFYEPGPGRTWLAGVQWNWQR